MISTKSNRLLPFLGTKFCLIVALCIFAFTATAQTKLASGGLLYAKHGAVPGNYNFWMYTPYDYDDVHKFPLVVYLHGASCCGNDLMKVRRYGVIDAVDKGKVVPALIIAPQNPGGAWSPSKIMGLIEWVEQNYKVDESRIYVLGMSLGGYGTMDFCCEYPDKVAAAMALCGGCSRKNQDGLATLPFWIMHGTADAAVPISASKKVVEYLQSKGPTPLLRYDWMQGGSHGIYARLFYLQKTYDWLFSHCLKDNPRKVDRTFDIDRADIQQTYSELKWPKDQFEDD